MRGRAAYRDLLARFHGFHAAWEPAVAAALADEDFFGPRRKLHLLARDLRHLGLPSEAIPVLPRPLPAPAFHSRAEALGSLYVVEGSTLGGRMIAGQLRNGLGLSPETGGAYHASYGPAVGTMWRAFRNHLLAAIRSEAEADAALTGAHRTFALLQDWLVQPAPPLTVPMR